MGVTFWGNFASRTLVVPFHWRGMCVAHHVVDMPDRGQLLGAGPKQSILLNVAALRASVRQMGVDEP